MENNLHIDEKLEKQKIQEFFDKHNRLDPKDETAQRELLEQTIEELVMNTRFVAPVTIKDGEGDNKAITFQLIKSAQGDNFFPVFTSTEELEKWEGLKDYHTIVLTFDNYAKMLEPNDTCKGFVVNPFSDNFSVGRNTAAKWYEHKQMILHGHASHTITKDTKYELYAPSPFPFQLSDKLSEAAKNISGVNRIWLRGIKLDGVDGYLAVVDFDGDREKIFSELGNSSKDFLNGLPLHLIPLAPGLGEQATDGVYPIYAK